MSLDGFAELVGGLRSGDESAAAELVRRFEPEVRREIRIRFRLLDPRLRRLVDSVDVAQSVLASFLLRTAAGQFDLDAPEQLRGLLMAMARNKLGEAARRQRRRRRDLRRDQDGAADALDLAADDPSPSRLASGRELLRMFRERLSPEENQLASLRVEGHSWAGIAALLGGTPEARRKQYSRSVDRVASELGLAEMSWV